MFVSFATVFGASGYPFGGDYCTPGYQIPLKEGQRIRFEAIIPDLVNPIAEVSGGATPDVKWRMGGTKPPILTTTANPVPEATQIGRASCRERV